VLPGDDVQISKAVSGQAVDQLLLGFNHELLLHADQGHERKRNRQDDSQRVAMQATAVQSAIKTKRRFHGDKMHRVAYSPAEAVRSWPSSMRATSFRSRSASVAPSPG